MSHQGNISNSSEDEYDNESFDNESIEEVSDEESVSQELPEDVQSIEDLQRSSKSLTCSDDDVSEDENEEENSKDLSTMDSNENNKLVSQQSNNNIIQTQSPTEPNCHEIDESDSESVVELEITTNFEYLRIQTENNTPNLVAKDDSQSNDNFNAENESMGDQESEIELCVTSQTPTSFNSDNHAFHMDIIEKRTSSSTSIQPRSRNSNRKSLSFSNERMREIERHNQILLRKILTQKPSKTNQTCPSTRTTTSAVNRKKQQRQIDLDNLVLKRKIEAISQRRRTSLY